MRKYLQITVILGSFFILVFFKQQRVSDEVFAPIDKNSIIRRIQVTSAPMLTSPPKPRGQYKDGIFTGSVEDAFYGNIQVQAKISNGRIIDVVFLQSPNDNSTSLYINSQAKPLLTQEAIRVQSANVDIISGASASSQAFQVSLANALAQAK